MSDCVFEMNGLRVIDLSKELDPETETRRCKLRRFNTGGPIPDFHTDTRAARRVLPKSVPHRDAVYNVSHALLLGAAFASGDTELLTLALHDRLHEPYRRSLIEGYDAVEEAALSRGAHAFFLSGSGSTLMAVYTDPEFPERVLPQISAMPHRWTVLPLLPDRDGACVL